MIFRIHFTLPNGSQDSVVIEGDDIDELRERAEAEVAKRGATDPWSEELEE